MENKRNSDWRGLAAKLFCIGFFSVLLYLIFRYAIAALVPFLAAYLVSLTINPLASATSRATGLPRRLCAAVYLVLLIVLLIGAAVLGTRRLLLELGDFISGGEALDSMSKALLAAREKISVMAGESAVLGSLGERIFVFVSELETNIVNYIGGELPGIVSGAVSRAPSIFIGGAVTVMACYYFCVDGNILKDAIKKAIPEGYREGAERGFLLVTSALKKYLCAYLILMLITFCEVYAGLLILRVKYAFIIAAGVALVDLMPILGAGAVLVPWAAVCLFGGNLQLGIGLLVLCGVVTVVRQIAEPAVVGASVGLHPALSLFSIYAGFKLFGLFGMIAGPLAAFVISEILRQGREVKN